MHNLDHAHELAKELVNNHAKFKSFGWHDAPSDARNWCIVYTVNRDSDALARSNARQIDKALAPFLDDDDSPDVTTEHHGHWACGWIDGYAIRVYRPGTNDLTPAFLAYAELRLALDTYPILDEEDFSKEEHKEADEVWRTCYSTRDRIEYICDNREQFEFHSFADMLACARGDYFAGYASELLA